MSKIKLKALLNLTEQAPQPPMGGGDQLPPMGGMPPAGGMDAGNPQDAQQPETPLPAPDGSPEPEDPSEYDFTRDFRAFEDKKNKAEADAKKVLLDKMNEKLLNKTIIANASRGYGQPKTDYTIKNVKKISVEFWYKDYVVIATDENDKKYFLTPGINIKIEQGTGADEAPESNEPNGGQESPENPQQPQGQEQGPTPVDAQEAPNASTPAVPQPKAQTPPQSAQPQGGQEPPVTPGQEPAQPEEDPALVAKKKKLPPVNEWVQKDLNKFLAEYMAESTKNRFGKVNFIPYLTKTSSILTENVSSMKIKCELMIPASHMLQPLESRDIKLSAIDSMRTKNSMGKYTKGSVDIHKIGRYYLLEYTKESGWDY